MATANNVVVLALQAAYNGPHEGSCDFLYHLRSYLRRIPMAHHKKWAAARKAALANAPACNCYVEQAAEALRSLGIEPKKEE